MIYNLQVQLELSDGKKCDFIFQQIEIICFTEIVKIKQIFSLRLKCIGTFLVSIN